MNTRLGTFVIFVLGAIIGSATTWQLTRNKYARLAQDEIDSVKETFSKRENNIERSPVYHDQKEKPNIVEYAAKLQKEGYTNYSNVSNEKETELNNQPPYTISPEEFGEIDDYDKISLTYYADDVLTDNDDELIEFINEVVGPEALSSFGEYEDDSVFVRNDKMKCDYEILLNQGKYSDVIKKKPH